MAYFIVILIVIIFAFGIVIQALMYHNQKLNGELFETVFFTAYLVVAGENSIVSTMLDGKVKYESNCSKNLFI